MERLKNTSFYREAINEINYPFGNYYLFDGFVVAEINEDVIYTWEQHGKKVAEDLSNLYDTDGQDLVLITNRVNEYSVKPTDWIHFFKHSYKLKGYAIVSYSKTGFLNAILEKLFVPTQFKRFRTLENAFEWARGISDNRKSDS